MNTLYSVERNGVKVAEFYSAPNVCDKRMLEIILRLKPLPTDTWELWQEPRNALVNPKTEMQTYAVVHNTDVLDDHYTTYLGDKQISARVAK